jgi:diamine N-acetyltransferase
MLYNSVRKYSRVRDRCRNPRNDVPGAARIGIAIGEKLRRYPRRHTPRFIAETGFAILAPMTPILRPATNADIELLAVMMSEYYALDNLRFDGEIARRALSTLIDEPALGSAYVIVSDEPGAPEVGYTFLTYGFSLEFAGFFALVDELYVREAYRGRGMGASVMRQLEEQCTALGFAAIRLEVETENAGAQRLYHRLGFDAHDRYLMTKWLGKG